MNFGEWLTRGTALFALTCYAAGLALRMSARERVSRLGVARVFWTAGCCMFLVHVACAFQFVHHWSHTAAYEATARETFEVVGWNWGGGVYANYAFTLVWLIDTAWWWRGLKQYEARPWWINWLSQTYLAFMAFNATVVFGHGLARWLGMAACVCLLIVAAVRRRTNAKASG